MSELPDAWQATTVGECFLEIKNGTTATQNKLASGIPVSRIETIQKNKFDLNRIQHIESPSDGLVEAYGYQEGDIAFSHINSFEHVGKTALYEGKPETLIHGMNLLRLRRGHEHIHPKFAHYFMLSNFFREEVRKRVGHAVNQVSINQKKLSEVPFVLAPLDEQRRIVAKLEKLLSRMHAVQARLATIPDILKRFRQSVLAEACSGRLTVDWRKPASKLQPAGELLQRVCARRNEWLKAEIKTNPEARRLKAKLANHSFEIPTEINIPKDWSWASLLKSSWIVVDCHNKTAPYVKEGIPLVRTTNIKNGRLLTNQLKYVSKETYEYWSRRCPPRGGDILFTREAPMGESALIPEGFQLCMGQRTMLLRFFDDLVDPKYVSYALRDPIFLSRVDENSVGSGVKHLRVGDVEALTILIPPFAEQQEIVRRVEALFKTADALEARYRKAKAHVDKLTQSILAKAFRGELVPQDPNDEPASVLLERIRASQNAAQNRKDKDKSRKARVG